MGLDSYLNARKTLSPKKRKEKMYINYFNTLNESAVDDEDGLYVSEYFGNGKQILEDLAKLPRLDGQFGQLKTIKRVGDTWIVETEAGYWRKANQIHNWFVEHTQDGVDECQYTLVPVEKLEQLQLTIRQTLGGVKMPPNDNTKFNSYNWTPSNKVRDRLNGLMPSTAGFFFGSTDYDKYYLWDLKETRETLRKVLSKASKTNWEFIYHSSW
jgi:hypothetical protein